MLPNDEFGKCSFCGKIFEFAELEEHDGLCWSCYKSQMDNDWQERKDQEKDGA